MKYFLFFISLSLFFISCGSSRPSGYVQTAPNKTVYIGPNKNKRAPSKRFNSRPVTNKDIDSELVINESAVDAPEIGDPAFIQKLEIIDFAKTFQGTRYKYGGTTKAGMDCSGLVCTAFEKEQIQLPRSSREMATKGSKISIREVEPGDLVFFKTTNKNVISHVGLVVDTDGGNVRFIHSTTQAGVIISSLNEDYWNRTFVEVRRVI